MFPIFIEDSRVPVYLSYISPIEISAITILFFVFSRGKINDETKRHERIHFEQVKETLFVFFYILYLYDFIVGYFKYGNGEDAYFNIRAEKEAYQFEEDIEYLSKRKRYNWIFK